MKKTRFLALFVSSVMLSMSFMPTAAFAQETDSSDADVWEESYNKKIDADILVPKLEKAEENEKFTLWVWVVDRAKDDAICQQVRNRMIADGSWDNFSDSNSDAADRMIINDRRLQKEVYTQENPKIAASLQISDEDIIEIDTNSPILTLNLTKAEIKRISDSEYVTHIDYIDLNAVNVDQEEIIPWKNDYYNLYIDNAENKDIPEDIDTINLTYTTQDGFGFYQNDDGTAGVNGYYGHRTHVVIPHDTAEDKIVHVRHHVFYKNKSIASVELPNTVTEIHEYAFGGMTAVKRIYVPVSVRVIEKNAFSDMPEDFKMICVKGSAAEKYAEENNIQYAYPEDDDYKKDVCTYYFLAPDSWFKTESGALNENVGAHLYDPENEAPLWESLPGKKMTPAPEIGENVFKITGVSDSIESISFNDYTENGYRYNEQGSISIYRSHYAPTNGEVSYDSQSPFDKDLSVHDGMIYVLNNHNLSFPSRTDDISSYSGEWFTLEDYSKYSGYFGSYYFEGSLFGDLDKDGKVTAADALYVLRSSVGLEMCEGDDRKLADIDADSRITSDDALNILRYSIGADYGGGWGVLISHVNKT